MTKADLKGALLELCADDYYRVWELYWNYQGLSGTKDVDDEMFIATLQELAAAKKILPYDKNKYTNEFARTNLDLERLRSELGEVRSGNVREGLYWFSYA